MTVVDYCNGVKYVIACALSNPENTTPIAVTRLHHARRVLILLSTRELLVPYTLIFDADHTDPKLPII